MTQDSERRHRLMIVEDEVLLALDLEMIAEDAGYDVVGQAGRLDDAISAIDKSKPDLCLVDVHLLDGPTGVDVARHAVASSDALVVFVTANRAALPDDLAGAYGVIAKPYTVSGIKDVLGFLRRILEGEVRPAEEAPLELRVGVIQS